MTILNQALDVEPEAVKAEIAAMLAEVDRLPHGWIHLCEPGERFYREPADHVTRRASELRGVDDLRVELATGEYHRHYFADIYDMDGRRIPLQERPDEWGARQTRWPGPIPNSVTRMADDQFAVSRGTWQVTAEIVMDDGETAFEFDDFDLALRQDIEEGEAAARRFLDKHPEIAASAPAWVTDIEPFGFDDPNADPSDVDVDFTGQYDGLTVAASGTFTVATGELDMSAPSFTVAEIEAASIDELMARLDRIRDVASKFYAAVVGTGAQ